MSLFFGLAFENFFADTLPERPGGIRTFPLLALTGAACYALEPQHGVIFAAGLLVLGLWLFAYEWRADAAARGDFVVPLCNILAYLLGPIAMTQAPWVAIALTVAASMLLTSRQRLHQMARNVPLRDILTTGEFLLLVGVALPLLPDTPFAGLQELTPHRVLLAVVAVSTLSYGSYLLSRYARPHNAELAAAVLGGLYSSTATTVVLARRSREVAPTRDRSTGIVLATAFMYLRLLAIVTLFDLALARALLIPLFVLFLCAVAVAWMVYATTAKEATPQTPLAEVANPLQLGTAALFAALFVATTLATHFAQAHFGRNGLDALAAIVGITDIDPFVLSIAQGHVAAQPEIATTILIATASNNLLKALYTFVFAGRRLVRPILGLIGLAAGSLAAAALVGH
jgi:uncharacterized membrane protein (DUF4010 family)